MSDDLVAETLEYKDRTIRIVYDDSGANDPRGFDNVSNVVHWHSRYDLGEEIPEYIRDTRDLQEVLDWLIKEKKATHIFPLFMYDHSGISVWIGDNAPFMHHAQFDSGQVGFVYATPESIAMTGVDEDHIDEAIESEVKEWNDYLTGQVFGYQILDIDGKVEDDCYGFIGEEKYAIEEAKATVDSMDPIHVHNPKDAIIRADDGTLAGACACGHMIKSDPDERGGQWLLWD